MVEFQIKPKPVRVGPVVVCLTLTDAGNHPVTGTQIALEADMSHAGMSPVFAQANEVQPARYESHLSLGMAGDWVILLHGTLPNGEKLERQFRCKRCPAELGECESSVHPVGGEARLAAL